MNIKKYSWMVILPLFFSACQEDTLVNNDQQQGIYTLSGKMSAGSPLSRAQIDLSNTDGSKETAFWNEGDAIGIFQKKNGTISENVFTISSDYKEATAEDKGTALFLTEIPAGIIISYLVTDGPCICPCGTALIWNSSKVLWIICFLSSWFS